MSSNAYFNSTKTLLDDFAVKRRNKPSMLVADQAAPMVPVDINNKSYPVWDDFSLIDSSSKGIRPATGAAEEVQVTYSTDNYSCTEKAYMAKLDKRVEENAQPEFRVQQQYVGIITDKQLIRREIATADLLTNVTSFSGYTAALSGTDRWDYNSTTAATSDPRVQVQIAKKSIRNAGVVDPEQISLVCGSDVFLALQNNLSLLKTLNYTNPYAPSADILAKVLGLKSILVGSGIKKSGSTKSQIWGKFATFAYISEAPELEDVSVAKTFILKEHDLRIESWYDQMIRSWVFRSLWDYDIKLTSVSSGYLFSTVVS